MSSNIQLILKRLIDILLSLIGLVLLTVPFGLIALAIKLDSKGPAFFWQERVGKDGCSFKVWKFRTMVKGAARQGLGYNVAKNDSRITRVGSVLRNWGLDELPQLINVLVGEMSLVGPRPIKMSIRATDRVSIPGAINRAMTCSVHGLEPCILFLL